MQGLPDALAELASRHSGHHFATAQRCRFGARDLALATDHPDGLDAFVAALVPAAAPPRRTLAVWEVDPTALKFLSVLGPRDLAAYGAVRGLESSGWSVLWEPDLGRFCAHHARSGIALFARGSHIAAREAAEPFRPLLHWAAIADGNLVVHAGGLASPDLDGQMTAVLIAGPGNAGKSTFVRAGVAAGLEFLGDNVVEVTPVGGEVAGASGTATGGWAVHGVYASLKIRRPMMFPQAIPAVAPRWDDEAEKDIYSFGAVVSDHFSGPLPLGGLLVVEPSARGLAPLGRAAALFAIGPNTVAQFPLLEREVFERCGALVRSIRLSCIGHQPDVDAHGAAVREVIDGGSRIRPAGAVSAGAVSAGAVSASESS